MYYLLLIMKVYILFQKLNKVRREEKARGMSLNFLPNYTWIKERNCKAEEKVSCKSCDKKFARNCDHKRHMEEEDGIEKTFTCDQCDNCFSLEWRLRKHMTNHTEGVKFCHIFNNKKQCQYEDIGCQFLHTKSTKCKYTDCKNKLPVYP